MCDHKWRLSFTGYTAKATTLHYTCNLCQQWKKEVLEPEKQSLGKKSRSTKAQDLVNTLENITKEKYHQ